MYILINEDNTVNFADNHPIKEGLIFTGTRLIEFPEKTLAEVVKDIHPTEAYWDEENKRVIVNPRMSNKV